MIDRWFIPSWSGDYRLEADPMNGETASRLTVVDPTPAEVEQLRKFLAKCRKKGWIDGIEGISPTGQSTLRIGACIADAGHTLLARRGRKRPGILTTIVSKDGTVEAICAETPKPVEAAVAAPDAKKAVTTRRPTLCCPVPVAGPEVRASEVLRAFCTEQQWADWLRHGWLIAFGGLSGHAYRVAHRHSPVAIEQTKIAWDLDDDHIVHCYDWSVPPPEEVLAVKLTLERREHWIRNRSGMYTHTGGGLFHNPFMPDDRQSSDGIADAAFVSSFGASMRVGMGLRSDD